MTGNIFLRIYEGEKITAYPLMGKNSNARTVLFSDHCEYRGNIKNIAYNVILSVASCGWFFTVRISGEEKAKMDFIYLQDIGLASFGHIRSNEAYNSQYIDHKVFNDDCSYTVCSRQNQKQGECSPFLQQGSFVKTVSFSVDGYPLYGLSYKIDNKIAELSKPRLNNRIYQYEFAYTALQSKAFFLDTSEYEIVFYGFFIKDLKTAIEKPVSVPEIREIYNNTIKNLSKTNEKVLPDIKYDLSVSNVFSSPPFSDEELNSLYPNRLLEERDENGEEILSFFDEEKASHIITQEKELKTERPHGNIIITGKNDFIREDIITSTQYSYGVFSSHVALGNTSFNKIVSNCRNSLNVQKIHGQRLMVKIEGVYRLLTMPAVYEMGLNYGKWLYKIGEDVLEILVFTALDRPLVSFTARSSLGKSYNFIFYSKLSGGADEESSPSADITRKDKQIILRHGKNSMSSDVYPDMEFVFYTDKDFSLFDDCRFYPESGSMDENILVMEFINQDNISVLMEGRIDGKAADDLIMDFETETKKYKEWMHSSLNSFSLSLNGKKDIVNALNLQSLWYSHNARIHFSSPHGLEQYGGAAWGTRDVCQGPFEYFITSQNYSAARALLLKIYSAQFFDNGSWPQWFMFDGYSDIKAGESHGDVILWPMKAIADYINTTGDSSVLEEKVPYAARKKSFAENEKFSVFNHLEKQLDHIRTMFIEGTRLLCYRDGDWDDTLQPHDPSLRDKMASGWTNALFYQVLISLSRALNETYLKTELLSIAENVKKDFNKYIVSNGVAAGFVIFDKGKTKRLLHPEDKDTGLSYRLLPMKRAIIAELFEKDSAGFHLEVIKEHLFHPDGVRLMNTACRYNGGVNQFFARAETAANFGREIGLQYVHAHIRFIEALSKAGSAEDAWKALLQISPPLRKTVVKNALFCQANAYFSSSDGCFDNRYNAMRDFEKLRSGEINVKTGWRIYSSGPGIFLNQLISNILGIRFSPGMVIIDPVLPQELDGLCFNYAVDGRAVSFIYHIEGGGVKELKIQGKSLNFNRIENTYRIGGVLVSKNEFTENAVVDIYA